MIETIVKIRVRAVQDITYPGEIYPNLYLKSMTRYLPKWVFPPMIHLEI
jgi:hypothetical protein